MANSWLRLWHDMPNDPKWRTISRISKQPVAMVQAVFIHLLVSASRNVTRGHVDVTEEDLASSLDVTEEEIIPILDAMQGRVLDGDYISGWDKRQVNKEDNGNISSTAKSPAERKRAERERKKQLLLNEKSHGESRGVTNESPEVTTDKDKDKDKDKDLYPPLSPPEGKTGKNKFDPLSVELPEWLSPALWAEWVGYRKQLGKPIKTQQGVSGSINKLSAYRDKGHSPEYVVKLTMENEWRGLLVPEGMTSNKPRDVNAISQPDGFIPKGFRG